VIERVSHLHVDSPIGRPGLWPPLAVRPDLSRSFVYNGVGDRHNVMTRFHKPNIVKDIFFGSGRINAALERFKKNGSGVLVYLRDGAAGVPVAPIDGGHSAEADRNRQWREVGVGAQILRDLGVTSIRHLTSAMHDYKLSASASRSWPTSRLTDRCRAGPRERGTGFELAT